LSFRDFLAQSHLGLISTQHVGDKVRAVQSDERGEVIPDCLIEDIKDPVDHPADFVPELTFLEGYAYLALNMDYFKMVAVEIIRRTRVLQVAKLDRALLSSIVLECMRNLFVAWRSCGSRRLDLEDIF